MVITLSPCSSCSGLVHPFSTGQFGTGQFGIGPFRIRVVVLGESRTLGGGRRWQAGPGVVVLDVDDEACAALLGSSVAQHPDGWAEDIGR